MAKAGNWYYMVSRHTRSDRANPREVTLEVDLNGFSIKCKEDGKSMKVSMSDGEIDDLIGKLQLMKQYKKDN